MSGKTSVRSYSIRRFTADGPAEAEDLLVAEEPLEIRLGFGPATDRQQQRISVTMRTPGPHDFELARGFLYGEGIIESGEDIQQIIYCRDLERESSYGNVVRVELKPGLEPEVDRLQRNFYTSSSCGVCGKASIEALETLSCSAFAPGAPTFAASAVWELPALARAQQTLFRHTGGIHAATAFDLQGRMLASREDVGRHNAVDKLVGYLHQQGALPADDKLLLVSGRAGFELVQKAIRAGFRLMAAVGAPSSLAIDLAQEYHLTLIGFLRDDKFNVYAAPERLV